jgi:hypothetical protein
VKVVYYDYGGSHSTVTAAHLHLGRMPSDRTPSVREIMAQPAFDVADTQDLGKLRRMGTDEQGNEVYVLGLASGRAALAPAMRQFLALFGEDPGQLCMVNSMEHVNLAMRVGGFASRRLGLVALGRPLVAWGVQLQYQQQVRMVAQVRREIGAL